MPNFDERDFAAMLTARLGTLPASDDGAREAAAERNALLTKPAGALGRLEEIAIWLSGWQGTAPPRAERIRVAVFAGNHGIAARGVSAYPAEVTAQMVANFAAGGAAINQLARIAGAELVVVPLGLDRPTRDFTTGPAMEWSDFAAAMHAGAETVVPGLDVLCVGEMGIGNTTAAAAIAHGLFGGTASEWTGRGTGIDDDRLARKTARVEEGARLHCAEASDPLDLLRRLGGREIAAMSGAILAARERRVPVILDGYVAAAAAAPLAPARAGALDHCLAGHRSAEPGHGRLLAALGLAPLLDLDMRLGEASGAALAALLVRAAVETHRGMATFAGAGVSGADS